MPDGATSESMSVPHPSELGPSGRFRVRRSRWILLGAVVALVAVLTALFSFGLVNDPTLIRSPLIGRPAPNFTLPRLDAGGSMSLASLRGKVVVINFWASWCGPCRDEHPDLEAAWDRYRDHGVVVVGVSYQDRDANALAFRDELGGDWPLVQDARSRVALAYGVTGVPETFFVAPDGRVAAKSYGPVTYETLTEQISKLLPGGVAE
ncbi:MAG TPA: TlpA disulfide reductase family protein [Actinomycetota bacterium]|nr:TlpA disulfide reductase family protein [Actinomycetota bacterium]